MVSRETEVINKTGLHARPAAEISNLAMQFKSDIKIRNLNRSGIEADAKSIMRVLALGVSRGMQVEICADGEDEEAAVSQMIELIDSGFGEV